MNKDVVLLDLFSGIGGFHAGLERGGFNITKSYFSEIDKHAIAVYKYHFKDAEYVGSVTDLDGRTIARPNIITFGSPCQDFSLAGKRAGLEGQRSSLIGQAIRLITECRPDVFIWESVKGVFSSNSGADFWAVIQAFANIGGYRLEWQLINGKWFLPQNRERIYLVGHLATHERSQQSVFPIKGESNKNANVEQSNETTVIRTLSGGGHSGGNHSGMTLLIEPSHKHGEDRIYTDVAPTIKSRYGTGGDNIPYVVAQRGRGENNEQQLEPRRDGAINTLTGVQKDNLVFLLDGNIRRLTEVECERFQGFRDGWTEYGDYDGVVRKVAPSQRYKCLGNAVMVDCVEAIAKRLVELSSPKG